MNIILAEIRPGEPSPERSFSKPLVIVGRDQAECDIAFDRERNPMVSRKHAEIRWYQGHWLIVDLNSSYGTFLNGSRIAAPTPLTAGSQIQFGVDGPKLVVVWFEVSAENEDRGPAVATPAQGSTAVKQEQPARKPPPASLVNLGEPNTPHFAITKPLIWLGREPTCDLVFDASTATVSRKHASLRIEGVEYLLSDNDSFNGTLLNGQRIASDAALHDGDKIQLGMGGPVLEFSCPTGERRKPEVPQTAVENAAPAAASQTDAPPKTMVIKLDDQPQRLRATSDSEPQLLSTFQFGDTGQLKIGRDETNDIQLDGLQISKFHARIQNSGGEFTIEDLGSTNGVFLNGARVSKQAFGPDDAVQIGSFLIKADRQGVVRVFDTRSKTRVDCVGLTREVGGLFGSGKVKLLDNISLSIQPNEFVGLLGPSGAGKSSLIEALNGVRPADNGYVRINNLDLYRHLDSLKQAIGYVPQEDIIHRELTVYRTLYYVAKLRLSRDVSSAEIARMIDEVLDVTGLSERRDVQVSKLSGGQRKRVSIAVELVTKPSVIFLDEPTSGLDPATEDKVMRLFRQIAESGRTVIMTTHAMENVRLFDKIVVLMRGKVVYFGPPEDALKYLNASSFKELYDKLEEPIDAAVREQGEANRQAIVERAAEERRQKFLASPQHRELIERPLDELRGIQPTGVGKKRRLGIFGSVRQWFTLSRRYFEVLLRDKVNLAVLLLQAPVIALMTFFVMGAEQPRDFVYFVLALVAVWFGTSVSAREIIRERPVYRRERMFNLGIFPYLMSKLFVLGLIVFVQCLLLFVPLKFFDLVGLMSMPGELAGIPQFWAMLLTAGVGIATGLFVSSLFRTQEIASSLVPLILIPQILFSGLVGVPTGVSRVVSLTMPAAWSFDTMKRFSTLETLEPEGAVPGDSTNGLGLYKFIEAENDKTLAKAERDIADYKQLGGGGTDGSGSSTLDDRLKVPAIKKVPADLSPYVTFMHPWMNEVLNQIVLMLMFGILVISTLIVLRLRDIR